MVVGRRILMLTPQRAVELGGEDIQRFYDGDEVALWTQMSAAMRGAVQNQEVLKNFTEHMAKNFGTEEEVIHQDAVFVPPAGMQYHADREVFEDRRTDGGDLYVHRQRDD